MHPCTGQLPLPRRVGGHAWHAVQPLPPPFLRSRRRPSGRFACCWGCVGAGGVVLCQLHRSAVRLGFCLVCSWVCGCWAFVWGCSVCWLAFAVSRGACLFRLVFRAGCCLASGCLPSVCSSLLAGSLAARFWARVRSALDRLHAWRVKWFANIGRLAFRYIDALTRNGFTGNVFSP